jgi:hypothetical protein
MLARGSIETAITGLFCIYVPGAEKLFESEMSKRAKRLFAGVTEAAGMAGVLDDALARIGSNRLPSVTGMVDQIVANGGAAGIGSLHTDSYDQVSTLYVHGGPLGLSRHVHPRSEVTRGRPQSAWSRRSAVHISDAMVGLLAAAIAGDDHPDIALFREYEQAHFRITWTPLAFVARGLMIARVDYRYLPDMIHVIRRLRAKRKAGESFTEADVDEIISRLHLITRLDPDDRSLASITDAVRTQLLRPPDAHV